jgi:hypothetical protein
MAAQVQHRNGDYGRSILTGMWPPHNSTRCCYATLPTMGTPPPPIHPPKGDYLELQTDFSYVFTFSTNWHFDRRPVGKSLLVSVPFWGPKPYLYYSQGGSSSLYITWRTTQKTPLLKFFSIFTSAYLLPRRRVYRVIAYQRPPPLFLLLSLVYSAVTYQWTSFSFPVFLLSAVVLP